jgi:hypothetical protein
MTRSAARSSREWPVVFALAPDWHAFSCLT